MTNRRTVGSLDSAHEDCIWAGLLSRQGRKRSALAAAVFSMKASANTLAKQILQPCTLDITAQDVR